MKVNECNTFFAGPFLQFEQNPTALTFVQGVYNHLICGITSNKFGLNATIQWWRRGQVNTDL